MSNPNRINILTRYNDNMSMTVIDKDSQREIITFPSCHNYPAIHKPCYIDDTTIVLPVLPGCIVINLLSGEFKRYDYETFSSYMVGNLYYIPDTKILITVGLFWQDAPALCFFDFSQPFIATKRVACIATDRCSINNVVYQDGKYIVSGTLEEIEDNSAEEHSDYEEISREYQFTKTFDLNYQLIDELKVFIREDRY